MRALGTMSTSGSSGPVSPTVAPYPPSTDYTSDDLKSAKITPWLRPEPGNSPVLQVAPRRSVPNQLAPHGGIRPAGRRRSRLALTLFEREEMRPYRHVSIAIVIQQVRRGGRA